MNRTDTRRYSQIVRLLSDMSHNNWDGEYRDLERELFALRAKYDLDVVASDDGRTRGTYGL